VGVRQAEGRGLFSYSSILRNELCVATVDNVDNASSFVRFCGTNFKLALVGFEFSD
jgi:hypothetical protein